MHLYHMQVITLTEELLRDARQAAGTSIPLAAANAAASLPSSSGQHLQGTSSMAGGKEYVDQGLCALHDLLTSAQLL